MLGGMKIYSDYPLRRVAQIAADLLALLVIVLGIWLGLTVGAAISFFAEAGRQLRSAGEGFQGAMTDAGDFLGQTPFVGETVRIPFDAASGAGSAIADAGTTTETFIVTTGTVVGIVVALAVAAAVLWVWLRRRLVFIRRATQAAGLAKLGDGPDLLALRALVNGSRRDLAAIDGNPVTAWRAGEPAIIRRLADLELREAGVRMPVLMRPAAAR
jgi:hypothetical protein